MKYNMNNFSAPWTIPGWCSWGWPPTTWFSILHLSSGCFSTHRNRPARWFYKSHHTKFKYFPKISQRYSKGILLSKCWDEMIITETQISNQMNLLFKAKPFDFSPRILTAIRSQPIEVLEMILNLANFDSFSTLPLLENKLICLAVSEQGWCTM